MEDKEVYVKVMADYCSSGLWNINGAHVEQDAYDLSPEILARLNKWNDWYETNDSWMCDNEDRRPFDTRMFALEGEQIARHIKAAHPDWTVWYFNEYHSEQQLPRDQQSYEIKC